MEKNHQRVGVVQILLLLAVILFAGGFGWYVWQNGREIDRTYQQAAQSDATASGVAASGVGGTCHSPDKSLEGHFYVAKGRAYSVCLPDGWKLLDMKTAGHTLLGSGLEYQAGVAPTVTPTTDGKDGPFELTIFASAAADTSAPSGYADAGTMRGVHMAGKKYTRTETADSGEGFGAIPKGTMQTVYIFSKGATAVTITYNFSPGSADASAAVAQLAASVNI